MLFLALTFVASLDPAVAAHPGHGDPVVMSGTITTITATRIEIDTFDRASFTSKRIWLVVDQKTAVRAGKQRLQLGDLRIGQEVDVAGETDLGPADEPLIRAITFRVKVKK